MKRIALIIVLWCSLPFSALSQTDCRICERTVSSYCTADDITLKWEKIKKWVVYNKETYGLTVEYSSDALHSMILSGKTPVTTYSSMERNHIARFYIEYKVTIEYEKNLLTARVHNIEFCSSINRYADPSDLPSSIIDTIIEEMESFESLFRIYGDGDHMSLFVTSSFEQYARTASMERNNQARFIRSSIDSKLSKIETALLDVLL